MEIPLTEDLERFVHDQVRCGRYHSAADVVKNALERLRDESPSSEAMETDLGSIGAMAEEAQLLDEIVEEAMRLRATRPWRLTASE